MSFDEIKSKIWNILKESGLSQEKQYNVVNDLCSRLKYSYGDTLVKNLWNSITGCKYCKPTENDLKYRNTLSDSSYEGIICKFHKKDYSRYKQEKMWDFNGHFNKEQEDEYEDYEDYEEEQGEHEEHDERISDTGTILEPISDKEPLTQYEILKNDLVNFMKIMDKECPWCEPTDIDVFLNVKSLYTGSCEDKMCDKHKIEYKTILVPRIRSIDPIPEKVAKIKARMDEHQKILVEQGKETLEEEKARKHREWEEHCNDMEHAREQRFEPYFISRKAQQDEALDTFFDLIMNKDAELLWNQIEKCTSCKPYSGDMSYKAQTLSSYPPYYGTMCSVHKAGYMAFCNKFCKIPRFIPQTGVKLVFGKYY
jgi:hypothetical protein